jgi:hypothetical protein
VARVAALMMTVFGVGSAVLMTLPLGVMAPHSHSHSHSHSPSRSHPSEKDYGHHASGFDSHPHSHHHDGEKHAAPEKESQRLR